jgi:uncharacterized protein (TIGR02391 family)
VREEKILINKMVMSRLREKLNVSTVAIYFRIQKLQEECLCTKEDAANLLAAEAGIPVYNILTEPELKRIRELQKLRTISSSRPLKEVREEEKPRMNEKPITPNRLYDLLNFHPRIVKASKSQFKSGHYTDAIFNAFRCIEVLVKEKSGLTGNGATLMHRVFSEEKPIIKLDKMKDEVEVDEQMGFKFIYAGVMKGIRNPKAHAEVQQKDPYRTLEYLALASLLAKRLEEGIKVNG